MKNLWRLKSHCPTNWYAKRMDEILVFPLHVGQSCKTKHDRIKCWPKRTSFVPGLNNVANKPLVDPKLVLLPPLHIKLGLMSNFVKTLKVEGKGYAYLRKKFPRLSEK